MPLPVVFVNGRIVSEGRFLTRHELAHLVAQATTTLPDGLVRAVAAVGAAAAVGDADAIETAVREARATGLADEPINTALRTGADAARRSPHGTRRLNHRSAKGDRGLIMRIAIISDIHGNLSALDAVLADLRTRPVDAVYCLGDLVGYAAHPNEVTERIRAEGIPTIMGNYDDGVGFERDECGCAYTNPVDKALGDQSLAWTKATVTSENKAFLRTLASESGSRRTAGAACPRESAADQRVPVRRPADLELPAAGGVLEADIIVFGHTTSRTRSSSTTCSS